MFNGENTAHHDDFNVDDLYSAVKSRRHCSSSNSNTSLSINHDKGRGQLESSQPPPSTPRTAAAAAVTVTKRKTIPRRAATKSKQTKKLPPSKTTKKRACPSTNSTSTTASPPPTKVSPSSQENATIATATATMPIISQSESIDEILSESDNLLRAAYEAQSLGRLTAAQSYLYLAHARLVGLGQLSLEHPRDMEYDDDDDLATFHGEIGGGEKNCTVGSMAGKTPCGASSLPSLPASKTTPEANHDTSSNTVNQENISDSLAHSAQELLYKKSGKGMQYNADVERKQRTRDLGKKDAKRVLVKNGRMKKKGSNKKQGSSSNHHSNFTAHGEITSKLLLLGEESTMTDESRIALPLVIPRTMLNCAQLDAQSLVESGG